MATEASVGGGIGELIEAQPGACKRKRKPRRGTKKQKLGAIGQKI